MKTVVCFYSDGKKVLSDSCMPDTFKFTGNYYYNTDNKTYSFEVELFEEYKLTWSDLFKDEKSIPKVNSERFYIHETIFHIEDHYSCNE